SILVGGAGPLAGVLAGAAVVGGVNNLLTVWVSPVAAMITVYVLAILIIRLKPEGLLGSAVRNSLTALIVFALLALAPAFISTYWTGQLTAYLVYGLLAISLSLVWGYGGILCFGQAMFFGIGGYLMAVITKGMILPGLTSSYLGLAAAMAGAGLFALALGSFLFAGRGISGAHLAIITLAMSLVLERLMTNWYALGGYNGLLNVPPLDLGLFGARLELVDRMPTFYVILGIVAAVYFAVVALLNTRYGLLMTAVRSHPDRLAFLGYSNLKLRLS